MTATVTTEVCALLGEGFRHCESPSLRLGKLVRLGPEKSLRADEVREVVACHRRSREAFRPDVLPFHRPPPGAVRFTARLGGRLLVNQAGGVLENAGLCLHRHFGHPMLPGSAVKGLAAHAGWCQWQDEPDAGKRRETALRIAVVFGFPTADSMPQQPQKRTRLPEQYLDEFVSQEFPDLFDPKRGKLRLLAGSVSFLAALPADPAKVELVADIVNCHHPEYYQRKRPTASDDEDPIPNVFPAVKEDAQFTFTLLPLRRPLPPALASLLPPGFTPVASARDWLVQAITLHGAGAKTAAGYGWFEYDEEEDRRRAVQRLAAEQAAREAEARRLEEERRRQDNAALKAQLAAMTPEQKADRAVAEWDERLFRTRLLNFASERKRGGPADEPERLAMVRALRHSRQALWTEFRTQATKGPAATALQAIYKLCKDKGLERP